MEQGQSVKFIIGGGSPIKSSTLGLVAALRVCGISFLNQKPLLDTVEEKDGELERRFVWSFGGQATALFRPAFPEETIELHEFAKRFNDAAWCQANADHPIAFLRAFSDELTNLRTTLKEMKPLLKIVRGSSNSRSIALIPADTSAEEKERILNEMEAAR
jgi:hypothetical protein